MAIAEPQVIRPLRELESADGPYQTCDDSQVFRDAQVCAPSQRVEENERQHPSFDENEDKKDDDVPFSTVSADGVVEWRWPRNVGRV